MRRVVLVWVVRAFTEARWSADGWRQVAADAEPTRREAEGTVARGTVLGTWIAQGFYCDRGWSHLRLILLTA